ncbi:MAG: hypothetical protein MJ079_00515 [Ruminococcus sp.]|nr:hypothetical protein [Ruminococcus sp.]
MHDPKYDETPDHSHYFACAARKASIDEFSRNAFVYTAGVCFIMLLITYCGVEMPLVSWIPSLFGCPTCVPFLFSQTAELLLVTFLSFLAFGKWKIIHIGQLIMYIALVLSTLASRSGIGIITLLIGIVGTVLTLPSFKIYSDYHQLIATEGWPHFSFHYTEAMEHPTYTSRYTAEYHAAPEERKSAPDSSEPHYDSTYGTLPKTGGIDDSEPEMADISSSVHITVPTAASAPELPDGDAFEPDSGLSDEPFDIQ